MRVVLGNLQSNIIIIIRINKLHIEIKPLFYSLLDADRFHFIVQKFGDFHMKINSLISFDTSSLCRTTLTC